MNSNSVLPKCSFKKFAQVTIGVAKELDGKEAAHIVRKSWQEVGVLEDGEETDESCVIL